MMERLPLVYNHYVYPFHQAQTSISSCTGCGTYNMLGRRIEAYPLGHAYVLSYILEEMKVWEIRTWRTVTDRGHVCIMVHLQAVNTANYLPTEIAQTSTKNATTINQEYLSGLHRLCTRYEYRHMSTTIHSRDGKQTVQRSIQVHIGKRRSLIIGKSMVCLSSPNAILSHSWVSALPP